jgi:hypothetical protein
MHATTPFPQQGSSSSLKIAAAAIVIGLLSCSSPLRAELRDFKGSSGKTIKAELKKAKGQTIFLRTVEGKDLQIPLKSFVREDQDFILKWIAEDPAAIDYNFAIKASEKLLESVKMRGYYERSGVQRKAYEIEVRNGVLNAVDGLKMEYRCFFQDRVASYSGGSGMYAMSAPQVSFKGGETEIPTLNYNASFQFTTKGYTLESLKEAYGTGSLVRDRLLGVWLKFSRHGTPIAEWKSQGCPRCEWPEMPRSTEEGGDRPKNFGENMDDPPKPKSPPVPESIPSAPATPKNPEGEKPSTTPKPEPKSPASPPPSSTPKPPAAPAGPAKKQDSDSGGDDDAVLLKIFELDDDKKK